MVCYSVVCLLVAAFNLGLLSRQIAAKLVTFTVATESTDGFNRFMKSAGASHLNVKVLGSGIEWKGGDVKRFSGGGQKVNLLSEALEPYKFDADLVVLFVDSYDVIIDGTEDEILKRFLKFDANIVFSAEGYCWPDKSLTNKYPIVRFGKRFLNSGGFIGYASFLYDLVTFKKIEDDDDDQLFYTHAYLDEALREKLKILLDSQSTIFQNLNGATDDVQLQFTDASSRLTVKNIFYESSPIIIHGNGASKNYLNYLGNYIGDNWNPVGCPGCAHNVVHFTETALPTVTVAIFIEKPTPFITEFFRRLQELNYPSEKISVFVHNKEPYHNSDVKAFLSDIADKYAHILDTELSISEREARKSSIVFTMNQKSSFLFSVDSDAQLTNPDTLRLLVEQNRDFIAPLLTRPGKLWSNFWGSVNDEGFYARSEDYVYIAQNKRRGVWNVPFVNSAYLIKAERLEKLKHAFSYSAKLDPDMSLCQFCRDNGYFMYVSNMHDFGHLTNPDTFDVTHLHNELYQIFDNREDWEVRYIHENYSALLIEDSVIEQPCPDVFWFPVVSEKFCWHLIEEMENYGKWSDGSNKDSRLNGGYENVPTRDIHMNQVGLEKVWLHFLNEYIRPVQEKVYLGYYSQPPRAIMNFVVRYKPGEQDHLQPHHDASTYTININLNRPSVDYQGGGARFLRYNCSVTDLRQGWALMHPGRLTHLHEGLKTTSGMRYIMVSFIDP